MANELVLTGDAKFVMPDYLREEYADKPSNIVLSLGLPSLTIMGKVFSLNVDGEKTKLMKIVDDEEIPLPSLAVVILDYAKRRGRNYFEGAFDPDAVSAPVCYSLDGIAPEEDSEKKQNPKCATCPMAVKGSRVSDGGKPVAACQENRILAVVPVKRMDLQPLRLKLAITSDYDGQSKDLMAKNLFAYSNYLAFCAQRGITDPAQVVTKISFDPGVAYPKLLFQPTRWLEKPELARVKALKDEGGVDAILGRTRFMPGQQPAIEPPKDGLPHASNKPTEKVDTAAEAAKTAEAEKAAKKAAKKAEKDKAAAAAAEAAKVAAAAAAEDVDEDDDEGAGLAAVATTKPADKPAVSTKTTVEAVTKDIPDDVSSLLNQWEED